MKRHLVLLEIFVILVSVVFSGCNQLNTSYSTEKNKFVGTWICLIPTDTGSNYTFTYDFFPNGSFIFQKPNKITNGTFDLIDGNLWLITNVTGNKIYDECVYSFSENNTMLTIEGYTYIKTTKSLTLL